MTQIENNPDERIFLIVADGTPAMNSALYFACRRVQAIDYGRVGIFHCIDDTQVDNMFGVGDIFRQEAEEEREKLLTQLSLSVNKLTEKEPIIFTETGNVAERFLHIIGNESINVAVLGVDDSSDGPGYIISQLIKDGLHRINIPLTLVPANMSYSDIKDITYSDDTQNTQNT